MYKWRFYSSEKNDVGSLHFYHNELVHFFQSELYTNVKMSRRQWFKKFTYSS